MGLSWWTAVSLVVSLGLAGGSLVGLARGSGARVLCAGHALMALGMAVMWSPWAAVVPPAGGAAVFGALCLWSGGLVVRRPGARAGAAVQLCLGSAVMAGMYGLEQHGGHTPVHPDAAPPSVLLTLVALACAGGFVLHVGRCLGRLAMLPAGSVWSQTSAAGQRTDLARQAAMSALMVLMLASQAVGPAHDLPRPVGGEHTAVQHTG
ncbi:DUF5134 domain-containing protein [Geodermatophilus sp. SYSU D01176]